MWNQTFGCHLVSPSLSFPLCFASLFCIPVAQEPAQSPSARAASRSDKQGNPFEFFQLLASLTKRW